jgi:hypothetical protein
VSHNQDKTEVYDVLNTDIKINKKPAIYFEWFFSVFVFVAYWF